jgi:gliding motility-associated protein GldM
MINMMYLVLTALLALNVSAEILNAFKTVNQSLMTSSGVIDDKNAGIFRSFEQKLKDPKTTEKAAKWKPKADQAKKLADDLSTYLDNLKQELKKESDLKVVNGVEDFKADNLDAATRLMVEKAPSGKGKGEELFKKLDQFKKDMLAIDPEIAKEFEKTLPIDLTTPKTEHEGNKDWSSAYFRMTPTIAAITILSKFQNDVKNSEAQIVEFCHKKIGEVELVYDEFAAFAGTNSNYLMPGQELQITAGVGAFSKAARPNVSIDGASVALNAQGVAEYKTTVGGPNSYSKMVRITFTKPDGTPGSVEKKVDYVVGNPTGISVSTDATRVLYLGLENPVSISGGSVGAEKVKASSSNGSLDDKGNGKFIARPASLGEAVITVSVDNKPTSFPLKVKRVPDPTPMVGASNGGRMAANAFKAQQGVRAELKDFIFEGVTYNITSFTLVANGGPLSNLQFSPNAGGLFTGDTRRVIEKCGPGTMVSIDEIKAKGPDGTTRNLPAMAFNLF